MMDLAIALLVALSLLRCLDAQASVEWSLFENFTVSFNRDYVDNATTSLERFRIFQESLKRQAEFNAYESERGGTAVYGVNKFSDLTPREFQTLYLSGMRPSYGTSTSTDPFRAAALKADLPEAFSWRDKGVITSVRNQKRCGSCWAFAVVETIESKYAIDNDGHLFALSPQQLISCEKVQGLDGCDGGILTTAFETLKRNHTTIVKESNYPFESGDGKSHKCKTSLPTVGVQLDGYFYSESLRNETEMKVLLYNHSPLTTSVNAVGWQDYIGGIIQHHCTGSHAYIDHAIQVVGYTMTDGPIPYWLVRNTWGTDWGEKGYVRIKYGSNMCGIAQEVAAVLSVTGVNI